MFISIAIIDPSPKNVEIGQSLSAPVRTKNITSQAVNRIRPMEDRLR